MGVVFFFSSRRRHTRLVRDWSSDVCSSDLRNIAVIFATDVVGYSKSVEKNEDQTIKNFRVCKKILEDLFKEHDGRIFNTAGDSVLAEFSSAVSAVICATEFQKLIKERNESETTDLKKIGRAHV